MAQESTSSTSITSENMSCSQMYQEFLKIEEHCEDSVQSIISNFDALIKKLKSNDNDNDDNGNHSHLSHLNNLELIRSMTVKHPLPFKWKKLLHLGKKSAFINRYNEYYNNEDNDILSKSQEQDTKTLIIGCGPSGLRTAIELSLYGNKNIQLIDSRDHWSRKQIVAIWNITESDLKSFGIRDLLPKFTKNADKKSIPITFLQHFLLRVALILGVNIRTNIEFKGIDFLNNKVNLYNKNTQKLEQYENDYDIIIDATGTVGALRDCPMISKPQNTDDNEEDNNISSEEEEKEAIADTDEDVIQLIGSRRASRLKKDVFGIVANFKRTRGDNKVEQILGKSYYLFQKEFDSKQIALENIVYYRSELTNYLVATVKKSSLIEQNVFIDHRLRGKKLLNKDNVNKEPLREMILTVAKEWNIPHPKKSNPFNILTRGNDDFAVFEFGKLKVAKQPIKFIKRGRAKYDEEEDDGDIKEQYQMIACVGDAECAPFWPKGTGVNHAWIGMYLLVDIIKKWNVDDGRNDTEYVQEIELNAKKDFDQLHSDLGDKLWHKNKIGHKYLPDYTVNSLL